jgi:hypothetical protein
MADDKKPPTLFPLEPLVEPADLPASSSNAERAKAFHEANTSVYRRLVELARERKAAGYRRWSITALYEIVRLEGIYTHGDKYRLNNNHKPFYAREIMAREADLAGLFEIRRSPHDPEYHERGEQ